ncbi:acetylxylan esterase [Mucilaginibacter sabulilitoris]|uniref:Acetylxylan esterase n=1 Tax=Mucilaginibacter sabulilitoris TaxID=1173583 RepID=A0ABZ0TUQ1_9SPHI|nr:acetylxylan esterase [Mucilaginibacter sabulilitoris]WPU95509.1 acetylxylan esterase [Mucilaginibacter sabulilitoris]
MLLLQIVALSFISITTYGQLQDTTVKIIVNADHPDWVYKTGQEVTFSIEGFKGSAHLSGTKIHYEIGPEKMDPQISGDTVFSDAPIRIKGGTMITPGFLRCTVTAGVDGKKYSGLATAGFDPLKIQATAKAPAGFMEFWNKAKAEAAKVPMDAQVTLIKEKCTDKINVYLVNIQNYQLRTRLYGILCVPKKAGTFPAVLEVPGAGVRAYSANIAIAERDVISLQIGIHGIPVNMNGPVYDNLAQGALRGYQTFNLDDKDNYYYKRVYLGCIRAVDFIFSLPKFDGKNIAVSGGSQGGALAIVTAALDNRIKCLASFYPALSDLTGYFSNRASGWPNMFNKKNPVNIKPDKIETASYYDVVNFARFIKVPGFYSWGFNDLTCPPTSTYSSYNVITAPKQLFIAKENGHISNAEQRDKKNEWMLSILFSKNK